MKKLIPFLLAVVLFGCKKSNDAPPDDPTNTSFRITIQSAEVVNNELNVSYTVENPATISKCTLLIYKTDATSIDYQYDIPAKSGAAIITCSHYGDASPMLCQYRYNYKDGRTSFSDTFMQAYN